VLADNRMALDAGWDNDLLKIELQDLGDAGFDLALTGFDLGEIAALTLDETEGLTDPDAVPDAPAVPVTVLGDVWLLGRHRIACGSSTDANTVNAVLAGVKPHLMVTDPPYGVEYDANWRNEVDRANGKPYGAVAVGKVENDDRSDWSDAWALFSGDVAYVWHGEKQLVLLGSELEKSGFHLRNLIVWAKSNLVIGRGNYHSQHETCWYIVRKKSGATGHWAGDRKQTTLWQIPKPQKSETGHSTQKPVECMKRPIENNSSPGQAVYEPFSGSGTTIIAGEMTGRCVYAIELNPAYVDMAVIRWQNFTGQTATLEATGQPFEAPCHL
jgi:DNA modification methylase